MGKRGIIVSPPFEVYPNGAINVGGSINSIELRKYLMYWDEIDYPDNNFISIGLNPDMTFLQECGVLSRTFVRFQGPISSHNGESFFRAQQEAYDQNEKNNPGAWSLGQISESPIHSNGNVLPSVEFNLFNMLPVPNEDVPLNDILEFKEKRCDELVALRIYLDEVYQSIIKSGDIPRAMNSEIARLEASLKALNICLSESSIRKTITSLRSYVACEFGSALGAGLGGAGVSTVVQMSPILLGTACAGLALGVKPMLSPKQEVKQTPFTYLKSQRVEFGD